MRMPLRILPLALVVCCRAFAQPCNEVQIDTEDAAIRTLSDRSPAASDAISRQCIASAIEVSSALRSSKAIPQLIRYLSFKKDEPPDVGNVVVLLHPPIEGEDYPAVVALARIGPPARIALLQTIESKSPAQIEFQNAAHAIALSFLHEPGHAPGEAILYLREAEPEADAKARQNLEQAVSSILKTPACARAQSGCTDSARKAPPK